MRRLAIAALSAATILSACTDKTRETPTEPGTPAPSMGKGGVGPCQSPFPLTALLTKTAAMFGGSATSSDADARIRAIGDECRRGKVGSAQQDALTFVNWMLKKYNTNQLPSGTALELTDEISTLFVAVGIQNGEIDPGVFGPNGAAGIYDGDELLLQNQNKSLSLLIRADACLPRSFISMMRLPDSPQLINTGGRRQFPPFYDINAANPEGDHTTCNDLLVGFCADDAVYAQTDNPQIGHNPTAQAQEELDIGDFEVLRAASPGEYTELNLEFCPEQANPGFEIEIGLSPAGGLEGLALSAWQRARGYVRPLTNALLPQQLHATTVVGGLGLGGGGRSISPFGVVDDVVPGFTSDGNPDDRSFESDGENPTPIRWINSCEGFCFPTVQVLDFFGFGVSGVDVNVTLVPDPESSGELRDGEGGTPGAVTTDGFGKAVFDDLHVTADGTYQLEFTIRGSTISPSGSISVGSF